MKKLFAAVAATLLLVTIAYMFSNRPKPSVVAVEDMTPIVAEYEGLLVERLNAEDIAVTVGGNALEGFNYDFYVSDRMKLMVETEFVRKLLNCSVVEYPDGSILIMRGDNKIMLEVGSGKATVNNTIKVDMSSKVIYDDDKGKTFIPFNDISEYLNYKVKYSLDSKWIDLVKLAETEKLLPARYDMREFGRTSAVRDQGKSGTCWAFASLGALESSLLPMEQTCFSPDHMTMCNSYKRSTDKGGEALMSIAYMAAWQGPVYEEDDPYGDGMSNPNLEAVKHLEEAIIIKDRDIQTIKSAVFRYGGAETSMYMQLAYVDSVSAYYSKDNSAYYYDGIEQPNHDVVIVGWDDNYPKERFTIEPEGNGAFICKNSWGEAFGEGGYFYVSYYDSNICNTAVVYSRIGEANNYDKLYQSDLLGWVGQIGFGDEECYLANVYTAGEGENLAAAAFYATAPDTEFEMYVVRHFEGTDSLKNREYVVAGSMKYAGYYTVDFPEEIPLDDGETFAVVVKIKTPGVDYPVAIEYNHDENTSSFDISDGQGYISLYGEIWQSAEEKENCNVCLKAFTRKR